MGSMAERLWSDVENEQSWKERWRGAILTTASFSGVQMSWAVQIGLVSPTLRSLGCSVAALSYAWLAGPITGMIVQPLIGVWSDGCTSKLGRRKPFLIGGAVTTITGLILFSNAEALGYALGDSTSNHPRGLALAIVAFWLLDAATNVAQSPQRALLTDTIPARDLPLGNAMFAAFNGVGKAAGYGLGAVCLTSFIVLAPLKTQLRALYTLAALYLAIVMTVTCVGVREEPWTTQTVQKKNHCVATWNALVALARRLPSSVLRAFITQFFAYGAWFSTFIYCATWMGEVIYGGDPTSGSGDACSDLSAYDKGVLRANSGFFYMATISFFWAPTLPPLCRFFGVRIVWAAHLLVLAGSLMSMPLLHEGQKSAAVALLALLGFPLAATVKIPWSVVTAAAGRRIHEEEIGLITTMFNLSQCLPEIVVSLTAGSVVSAFGSVSSALFLGGLFALGGAVSCRWVLEPRELYGRSDGEGSSSGSGREQTTSACIAPDDDASAAAAAEDDNSSGGGGASSGSQGGGGALDRRQLVEMSPARARGPWWSRGGQGDESGGGGGGGASREGEML